MSFQEDFDLTPHNTFGIRAKAAYYASFESVDTLRDLVTEAPKQPLIILGGGSNMLLTQDITGTVLHNKIIGKQILEENQENVVLRVGAGENWHELVLYSVSNQWGGIENLSLIPGCVGASPMQNIGAYGVEIKDVLVEVEAFHIQSREIHKFSNEACEFGYRESVFKRKFKNEYVITHVTYRLSKKHEIKVDYGAIKEILHKNQVVEPTIRDISQAVIEIRSSKLPDPKIIGNAGSFFKNPVVEKSVFSAIHADFPEVPFYPIDENTVKIPAGWLIETAGWKGKDFGNYGVHDKQALVLVNRGGANGQEIFTLSEKIIQDIHEKFGIILEREVNIL